jgi:hypothetical protein
VSKDIFLFYFVNSSFAVSIQLKIIRIRLNFRQGYPYIPFGTQAYGKGTMEAVPEEDRMKRFYPSLKIIPQTLDRTFSKR